MNNLQPFLITVLNKTEEQLNSIPKSEMVNSIFYDLLFDLNYFTFDVTGTIQIMYITPEDLEIVKKFHESLGIEITVSVKKGRDYIFNHQLHINDTGSLEFTLTNIRYICENFTEDDVYAKIKSGNVEITEEDKYLLEIA